MIIYNVIAYSELLNIDFPQNSMFGANVEIGERFFYNDSVSDFVFLGSSITHSTGFEKVKKSAMVDFGKKLKKLNFQLRVEVNMWWCSWYIPKHDLRH